jgi:polyphosphate kinase
MAAVRAKKRTAAAADRLINRELSFLDYDARVLALAQDSDLPLLERVRFCSIFSHMLDEFFMTRIAGLSGQAAAGITVRSPDGRTPQQALREARERVLELQADQAQVWSGELCPALASEGIAIARVEDLSESEQSELERRYERDIYPVLTPLAVGPGQPFPYISGLSISLAVFVRDPENGEERFARVKVPEGLPRFLSLGEGDRLVPLEQVLSHFLPSLFPGVDVLERSVSSCAAGGSARSPVSRCPRRCRVRCANGCSRVCTSLTSSSTRPTARLTSLMSRS